MNSASIAFCALLLASGCSAGNQPAPAPPCDQACQDGVALLGTRTMLKFAYNFLVQGKAVGPQQGVHPCLPGPAGTGTVQVSGDAESNAVQGASEVRLSYDFQNCLYVAPADPSAAQNFSLTLTGVVSELGTIAVQPSATTALSIQSDSLTIVGTVYDPPLDYAASDCALAVNQNGNAVAGSLCGRSASFSF